MEDEPMDSPASETTLTPAEGIAMLSEIDKDIARLIAAGGNAFKALALETDAEERGEDKIGASKAAFTASTTEYFTLLAAIHGRMKTQIRALEAAKIISSRDVTFSMTDEKGGSGIIDAGSLRTRTDTVEKDMEAEIWGRAAKLVKSLENKNDARQDLEVE